MIVGHGDIAKAINTDRVDAIYFASGISDSLYAGDKEFLREEQMIKSFSLNGYTKTFFYFSSMSIFFKESKYTEHKKKMEDLVSKLYCHHWIIRLGNIWWGENPNTFLNYLKNRIDNNQPYKVKEEWKYMIERHDFQQVVCNLPLFAGGHTICLCSDVMKVEQALKRYMEL